MNELIQITDEHDNLVRGGTMDDAQFNGLWHRVAYVMVFDKATKRYLLQKVAPNPWYDGGLWNVTARGHVDEGESYEVAALRELGEEMGVTGLSLQQVWKDKVERQDGRRMYRQHRVFFLAEVENMPSVEPNDEVEDYWWLSREELLSLDASLSTEGLQTYVELLSRPTS